MATIYEEIELDRAPAEVWEVVGDWDQGPVRMAPGFVTASVRDCPDRLVSFINGVTVREVLLGRDDARLRVAWSIVDSAATHHNGAFEVHAAEGGRTRLTWIADVLPEAAAANFGEMMRHGMGVMSKALAG